MFIVTLSYSSVSRILEEVFIDSCANLRNGEYVAFLDGCRLRRKKKRRGARRTPTKVFATPDTGKFHRICASGIINLRLFPPSGTRWPSHRALRPKK